MSRDAVNIPGMRSRVGPKFFGPRQRLGLSEAGEALNRDGMHGLQSGAEEYGEKLMLQKALPLWVLMIVMGAIFLITLLISLFSLKVGISSIFDHGTIGPLPTLGLSTYLLYSGLITHLRSIHPGQHPSNELFALAGEQG